MGMSAKALAKAVAGKAQAQCASLSEKMETLRLERRLPLRHQKAPSVQALASQLDGWTPPPKLGAAPGCGICPTGLLPPLSREGAQGLPAAPEEAGAIAARPGKQTGVRSSFEDAASSGSWVNRIQRAAQESPGALPDSGLKRAKGKSKDKGEDRPRA